VPQRGVTRDEKGNATALVVGADGTVERRMLDVSQTVGSAWLVKRGINAGDRVIVEGLQYARAGEKANAVAFVPADAKKQIEVPPLAPATAAGKK